MANNLSQIMETLLNQETLSNISKNSGVSSDEVAKVLASALPKLLDGASAQSSNEKTAAGFAQALEDHSGVDFSSLTNFFSKIDLGDGAKIVQHLLGKDEDDVKEKTSKKSGINSTAVSAVLACAAPLLMSALGKQAKSNKKKDNDSLASLAGQLLGGGDAMDVVGVLGSLLKK